MRATMMVLILGGIVLAVGAMLFLASRSELLPEDMALETEEPTRAAPGESVETTLVVDDEIRVRRSENAGRDLTGIDSADTVMPAWAVKLSPDRPELAFAGGRAPTIRVLDSDARPVAGARVAVLRWDNSCIDKQTGIGDYRSIFACAAAGLLSTTNEEGKAAMRLHKSRVKPEVEAVERLDSDSSYITIAAWAGDRFGHLELNASMVRAGANFDVTVHRDSLVRVRVLDAEGRPAIGLRVSLHRWGPDESVPIANLRTDEAGLVTVRHWRSLCAGDEQRMIFVADAIVAARPYVTVHGAVSNGEYTLRLPPTGRVNVTFRADGGHVLCGRLRVTHQPADMYLDGSRLSFRWQTARFVGTKAVFEYVGVGHGLRLNASMPGRSSSCITTVEGPALLCATAEREVRVELDGVLLTCTARIALDEGDNVTFSHGHVLAGGRKISVTGGLVMEDGRVDFGYSSKDLGRHRALLRIDTKATSYFATRDFDVDRPGRVIDLGEVQFLPKKRVAHGTVLREQGRAAGGINVSLQYYLKDRADHGFDPTESPINMWTMTGEDGRFEIFGTDLDWPLVFVAQHPDYHPVRMRTTTEDRRYDIQLVRFSNVDIIVHTDSEAAAIVKHQFAVTARGETQQRENMQLIGDGTFKTTFEGLAAGTYSFDFHVRPWSKPVATWADIRLEGDDCVLQRDLSLDSALYRYRFDLDRSSCASPGAEVHVVTAHVDESLIGDQEILNTRRAFAECLNPWSKLYYIATSAGCAPLRGTATPGTTRLRFEPNPLLDFVVPRVSMALADVPNAKATLIFANEAGSSDAPTHGRLESFRLRLPLRCELVDDRCALRFTYPKQHYAVRLELASRKEHPIPHAIAVLDLGTLCPAEIGGGKRFEGFEAAISQAVLSMKAQLAERASRR